MPRKSPIRPRLVQHIKDLCEQDDQQFLPSIRHMAAECSVSYETMWKAVDECRRAGLVQTTAGGRTRVVTPPAGPAGTAPEPEVRAPSPEPKWQRIRNRIRADLIQGVYERGRRLPPYKVLCDRYGAGFQVLRAALAALREEEFLEECPGGLRPRAAAHREAQDTVVLLAGTLRSSAGHGVEFGRNWDMVRALERECATAGCRLVRVDASAIQPESGGGLPEVQNALGAVLWTTGIAGDIRSRWVHALAATRKPLAVLDEAAQTDYPDSQHPLSVVQLFSLGCTQSAGSAIARHLLSLGHRHLAYFSSLTNEARLDGLRRTFTQAGGGHTVEVFRATVRDGGENWAERPGVVRISIPPKADLPKEATPRLARALTPRLALAALCETARVRFTPSFVRALENPRITAWVGCSDIIATQARRFLEEHKVTVPDAITVVGFDDSTEGAQDDLTSYNFNVSGLASAMVSHLLFPRPRRERRGFGEWYEPTGGVTVRASSGPAPVTGRPRR